MVFNTVGVRQNVTASRPQADQARLARQDGELALLTSLSTFLQDTDSALERTRAAEKACDPTIELTRQEELTIQRALRNYDYLAWLFNRPTWDLKAATQYWAPHMVLAYLSAAYGLGQRDTAKRYPELERFRVTLPAPQAACAADRR